MMSNRSCSKISFLNDGFRRNLYLTFLSFVAFVLTLLLPLLIMMQNALEKQRGTLVHSTPEELQRVWENAVSSVSDWLGVRGSSVVMAFIVLGAVGGLAAFAYLHTRQKVDFYHALPVSRPRWFATRFLSGIVCVFVPFLIVWAISVGCVAGMGFGEALEVPLLLCGLLQHFVFFLCIYSLSALCSIVCGHSIISTLLLLWALFGVWAAQGLFSGLCSWSFQTFVGSPLMGESLYWTPVGAYFVSGHEKFWMLLAIYAAVAVAAIVISLLLFTIRKSERSGIALAFFPARLPIEIFMCAVSGVAIGFLLAGIGNTEIWFWVGLVIGTVLMHWVVEIIYAFDFRAVFKNTLQLAVLLVVLVCGIVCMRLDVFGYDRWLPQADRVDAVSISGWLYDYAGGNSELTDPANIEYACKLAEQGVSALQSGESEKGNTAEVQIAFSGMGGKRMRRYRIPVNAETDSLLTGILDNEEYLRTQTALFAFDPTKYESTSIQVLTLETGSEGKSVTAPEQIAELLKTLQQERLENGTKGKLAAALDFYTSGDKSSNFADWLFGSTKVYDTDTKTIALLEKYTGGKVEPMSEQEVSSVEITYFGADDMQTVSVTDKQDIRALLADAEPTLAMSYDGTTSLPNYGFYANLTGAYQVYLVYPRAAPIEILEKYGFDPFAEDVQTTLW